MPIGVWKTYQKTRIRDDSDGTWRRIRPIPFNYRIPDEQVDKHFFENRLEPELPGILAWAVQGCLAWQCDGLGLPPEMAEARNAYRSESDAVKTFLTEYIIRDNALDAPTICARRSSQYVRVAPTSSRSPRSLRRPTLPRNSPTSRAN